jgi:membrane dipeptidase
LPVIDGHVDLLYALHKATVTTPFAGLADGPVTLRQLKRAGVRVVVGALYCTDACNGPGRAAGHLRELLAAAARQLTGLVPVRTAADLESCWRGEAGPGLLPLLENGDALADLEPGELEGHGLRVVGLTHAGANRLADGSGVAHPGGLRPAGRRLLAELSRRGWAIDTAHLADPGLAEVLADYAGPLLCSHTGLRRFCDRPRNLSDAQLRALFARGAVVGLALAPEMLTGTQRCSLEDFFVQLDWVVQRFGDAGVALGSDLGGFEGACAGMEDHGALGALAERMRRAGYPEETVGRIMGGNWQRFYARLLAADD